MSFIQNIPKDFYSKKERKFDFNGELMTINEISKLDICVVSLPLLRQRIYNGVDVVTAATTPKTTQRPQLEKKFNYKEGEYTLREIYNMSESSVPFKLFRSRVWNGMSIDRALSQKKGNFDISGSCFAVNRDLKIFNNSVEIKNFATSGRRSYKKL